MLSLILSNFRKSLEAISVGSFGAILARTDGEIVEETPGGISAGTLEQMYALKAWGIAKVNSRIFFYKKTTFGKIFVGSFGAIRARIFEVIVGGISKVATPDCWSSSRINFCNHSWEKSCSNY